ncbi:MAG: hypothetical protein IPK81_21685 [Rhodospirillales bacterium]|nr:MAG: hypothetical protein IPK81_21685 [Rhodospirillales bacterium]
MYGLDASVDLSFLVGRKVEGVLIGTHSTVVHFDEKCEISIVSEMEFGATGACIAMPEGMPAIRGQLAKIVGQKVESVQNRGGGNIILTFSNAFQLMLHDHETMYESYIISSATQTIVV